jgi:hypothetical protein
MTGWDTDFVGVEDDDSDSFDWSAPAFDKAADAEAEWDRINDEDSPPGLSDKEWSDWMADKDRRLDEVQGRVDEARGVARARTEQERSYAQSPLSREVAESKRQLAAAEAELARREAEGEPAGELNQLKVERARLERLVQQNDWRLPMAGYSDQHLAARQGDLEVQSEALELRIERIDPEKQPKTYARALEQRKELSRRIAAAKTELEIREVVPHVAKVRAARVESEARRRFDAEMNGLNIERANLMNGVARGIQGYDIDTATNRIAEIAHALSDPGGKRWAAAMEAAKADEAAGYR